MLNSFFTDGKLKEIEGSVVNPHTSGQGLILCPCGKNEGDNKVRKLLTKKWNKVRVDYRNWQPDSFSFKPGNVITTLVQSDCEVVHAYFLNDDGSPDEKAMDKALTEVKKLAKDIKGTLHISSALLAEFPKFDETIQKYFIKNGISVYIYKEPTI